MTFVPRYAFPRGTEITLLERPMVVTGHDDQGYRVADLDGGGVTTVLPFIRLTEQLKLSGARIHTDLPMTGGRLSQRLGGYATSQALSEDQRELAQVHLALCRAMEVYRDRLRAAPRRARHPTEWARIAAESLMSGASVVDVARKHGSTTRWQVYDWRKKLRTGL